MPNMTSVEKRQHAAHTIKPKIELKEKSNKENEVVDFFSLNKLNQHIGDIIKHNVFLLFIELLKTIANDYDEISFEELKKRYLKYFTTDNNHSNLFSDLLSANLETIDFNQLKQDLSSTPLVKQQIKAKPLPPSAVAPPGPSKPAVDETKCLARTAGQKQCSRRRQKGKEFCGSHLPKQPHGRIDQPIDPSKSKPKRRGRPPKNTNKPEPAIKPQVEVIQMSADIESINGIEYLVDTRGNIYKLPDNLEDEVNSDQLKLLGKKMENNSISWYSDTDLKFVDANVD